jgi:hypothetical protein
LKCISHPLNSPPSSRQLQKAPALALRPQSPKPASDKRAEREAAQQDVFMREVDEALRQDEMLGLFQRFGRPLIALVVVGLLGLGGWLWWDSAQQQEAGERGEKLVMAIEQVEAGNLAAADKQLAPLAEDAGDASAAAAKLMRAGIALGQDRRGEAVKLFAEVAADEDAPQPFRDLATIREVAANFDAMDPQQVVDRLKPLAIPGNPWFGNAGELVGIAYLKQGKEELAGPLFAQIARDEKAPETLRRRARQLAGLLGVDAVDDAAKAAAGDAPPVAGPAQQ